MADILIINGTDNKGFKDDFFTPVTAPLVSEIRIGNTVKKQDANTLNVLPSNSNFAKKDIFVFFGLFFVYILSLCG